MNRLFEGFRIVVDTREKLPLPLPAGIVERGTLRTGDYSLAGYENAFAVERKSLADLVRSLTQERARFERELERLAAIPFRRVLVEEPYRCLLVERFAFSQASPVAMRGSVEAYEVRYGIPFAFAETRAEAAARLTGWARRYWLDSRAALEAHSISRANYVDSRA